MSETTNKPAAAELCALQQLRFSLGTRLLSPAQVKPTAGLSTGWRELDLYLPWRGFPKGAVTLLVSEASGATTLWEQSAAQVTRHQQWAAWINGPGSELTPWSLRHAHVNLSKLLSISQPVDVAQTLWVLQELMSLCLFELIGCDLGDVWLREHQVLKLKKLAARYQTGIVLFTHSERVLKSSFYSLVLHFRQQQVIIHRALHCPTPYALERRALYADTLPQFTAGRPTHSLATNLTFGG